MNEYNPEGMHPLEYQDAPMNVLGGTLEPCCYEPMTGFWRDGTCHTGSDDSGRHTVCAIMTEEFLVFSKNRGNDLSTPHPEWNFPGLKGGDKWCLCALRWQEAYEAGVAPQVVLASTHKSTLKVATLESLQQHVHHTD
jgi:uncharacterized protein